MPVGYRSPEFPGQSSILIRTRCSIALTENLQQSRTIESNGSPADASNPHHHRVLSHWFYSESLLRLAECRPRLAEIFLICLNAESYWRIRLPATGSTESARSRAGS